MYVWLELIYHLPLSFWATGALIRGEISIPRNLNSYCVNVVGQMIPVFRFIFLFMQSK
jgi:hypothetical protein